MEGRVWGASRRCHRLRPTSTIRWWCAAVDTLCHHVTGHRHRVWCPVVCLQRQSLGSNSSLGARERESGGGSDSRRGSLAELTLDMSDLSRSASKPPRPPPTSATKLSPPQQPQPAAEARLHLSSLEVCGSLVQRFRCLQFSSAHTMPLAIGTSYWQKPLATFNSPRSARNAKKVDGLKCLSVAQASLSAFGFLDSEDLGGMSGLGSMGMAGMEVTRPVCTEFQSL